MLHSLVRRGGSPPAARAAVSLAAGGVLALVALSSAAPEARATSVNELTVNAQGYYLTYTDAGQTIFTAGNATSLGATGDIYGVLPGPDGAWPLDNAASPDVDLYRIYIPNVSSLSITAEGWDYAQPGDAPHPLENPQLFLFDQYGHGIAANDNVSGTWQPSSGASAGADLNSEIVGSFSPGYYLLGISTYDIDPVDRFGNPIFPDVQSGQVAATNGNTLSSWSGWDAGIRPKTGPDAADGKYVIHLSAVAAPAAVPEPGAVASGLIMGGSMLGGVFGTRVRRQRRRSAAA